MKRHANTIVHAVLVFGVFLVLAVGAVSAQGERQRGYTHRPPQDQFVELSSQQIRYGSRGAFVKPVGDKGRAIEIPPAPPGTFDNALRGEPHTK